MKIGLISDTHIPSMGKEPPAQVLQAFQGVDLILHAGDIYIQSCIDWLERIAPVQSATSGFSSATEAAPRMSVPMVIELEGFTIGMIHKLVMIPLPDDIYPGAIAARYPKDASIPDELFEIFGKRVDIVICGYTHEAMVETHQGVLFVNSGSPTMIKQIMKLGTVAILDLTPNGPEARIIDLKTLSVPE